MTNMKQKIVLEVFMPCDKCKKKARKIVASSDGMISMAIEAEKNHLVIVGVGMNTASLASSLGKKVGRTTIISVEEVNSEAKKKEEEEAKKKKEAEEAKKKKDEEEAKKKKEAEEAKKKKEAEEEEAKKNSNVPWCYNNCYNYPLPPPFYPGWYGGATCYPNTWFNW